MNTPSPALPRKDYFVLAALIAFLVPLTLFVFRHLDDNRLTGWGWVFNKTEPSAVFFILTSGLVAAYFLSKSSLPDRYPAAFLFTFSYIVCAVFWREPEVIVDTARYFTQAKHLAEYGIPYFFKEWGREIHAWTDLPLVPFIYGLIFKFFGESRIYIQIFTAALYSMTVVVTYLIGKTLWNKTMGINAGLLLLGIPYLHTQAPLMLVDVAAMCALICAVFSFIYALERGGIWIFIASAAVFATLVSKYSTWMMLSVLAVVLIVYLIQKNAFNLQRSTVNGQNSNTKSYILRASSVAIISMIPAVIIVLYKLEVILEQINLLMTFQKPALRGWSESFTSTYLYQIHPFITVAAIFSLYSAFKKKDLKQAIISWLPLLMLFLWVKRIRYVMPVFPMYALMASYGLEAVTYRELRRYLVYAAVSTSLVIAVCAYLPFLQKMSPANLRDAGGYLDSITSPVVEVISLPPKSYIIHPSVAVPILDLFTEKDIYYRYAQSETPEKANTSPLRFTWTYQNPQYYERTRTKGLTENRPIVVITSEHGEPLPEHIEKNLEGYRKTREFNLTTGVFRYSPDVIIYER